MTDKIIRKLIKKALKSGDLKTGLIFAGFGAFIYLSNRMIPKLADDYAFSFMWDGESNGNLAYGVHHYRRVRTLKDLVKSQVSHYKTWSGRTVAETLNQLILMKDDKILYDRINTGVIMAQLALCLWGGRQRISLKKISPAMALLMSGGYWFGAPHLAATGIWTTGAANYSWQGLLQSAFLLPWGLNYHDERFGIPKPLSAFAGLLAGWSNEAGGGMALILSAAALVRAKRRGQDTGWMVSGLLGAAAGYALLMLAPGNFRRMEIERKYSDILSEEICDPAMVPREDLYTPAMFFRYLKYSFLPVVLRELPLEIPVALYLTDSKRRSGKDTAYILALEAAAWGVPLILMLSPQFPKRAAYPGIIYRLTAAVKALEKLDISALNAHGKRRIPLILTGIAAGAGLFIHGAASLFVDADLYTQTEEQIRILRENRGNDNVKLPYIMLSPFWTRLAGDRGIDEQINKITGFDEFEGDPYNTAAAAYYGVGSIKAYKPSGHPYTKNDARSRREQFLRSVRSFLKRLKLGKYVR